MPLCLTFHVTVTCLWGQILSCCKQQLSTWPAKTCQSPAWMGLMGTETKAALPTPLYLHVGVEAVQRLCRETVSSSSHFVPDLQTNQKIQGRFLNLIYIILQATKIVRFPYQESAVWSFCPQCSQCAGIDLNLSQQTKPNKINQPSKLSKQWKVHTRILLECSVFLFFLLFYRNFSASSTSLMCPTLYGISTVQTSNINLPFSGS